MSEQTRGIASPSDQRVDPNRRSVLMTGGSPSRWRRRHASQPRRRRPPIRRPRPHRRRRRQPASRTFSSSWATTSARPTSAPIRAGVMGYKTPNIDRIADEGMMFTDYYAEQSCTAGRSTFITGQATACAPASARSDVPARGRPAGSRRARIARGAQAARLCHRPVRQEPSGRPATNTCRPMHGFDEFFGNLYHLNAEEEPEHRVSIPRTIPRSSRAVRPARRASDSGRSTGRDRQAGHRGHRPADQEAHGDGRRRDVARPRSISCERQAKANKPFFCWFNATRMHCRHACAAESMRGQSGIHRAHEYADGMIEHDGDVGTLLKALDDLGIANDTIVIYTTDNGRTNEHLAGCRRRRRSAAKRIPTGKARSACRAMVRWPGRIKAGSGLERDRVRPRLVPDAACRRRRPRHHRPSCSRAIRRATRPSRSISTATTSFRILTASRQSPRATNFHLLQR